MARLQRLAGIALGSAAIAAVGADYPQSADPGGCALTQLTRAGSGEIHFQFEGAASDGRSLFVAWEKGDSRGAYILDLATGRRRDVPGINNAGVFSRDGTRILVANSIADGTTDLVEYEIASGAMSPVAPGPKHEFLATYAPRDLGILFNSYRTGRSDIYLAPREGEPVRLTDFDGYEAHASFSPDGTTILFHRAVGEGDYDIYSIDFETRAVAPFIAGAGEQSYPSWSPDGRFVAFASDLGEQPGQTDIYIADATGRVVSRITRRPGYNTYPSWSKDGARLYFNSERSANSRNVFRADIGLDGHCRKAG